MATIKGALHYVCISRPQNAYQSDEKQWKVDVEISKTDAKAFKKKYKSQDRAVKEYDTEEFKAKYKVDPQISKGDEHYTVTLKQSCKINGKPFGRPPRVLMAGDNGKLQDVTKKFDVGNGSLGVVQITEIESRKWETTSAKLANVRVDTLVPYEGGGADLSELGDVDEDSFEDLAIDEESEDDDAPFEPDEDDSDDSDEY